MQVSEVLVDYEGFRTAISQGAQYFKTISPKETIRIVSHLDTDGLCSAAILINMCIKLNKKYALTVLPTVTVDSLVQLSEESEKNIIFADLGSASYTLLAQHLPEKTMIILDHHAPPTHESAPYIIHINPHLFGINGAEEISGSGVAFLFTNALCDNTEMSSIAIMGAIGDAQEHDGFKALNNEILSIALEKKLLEVKKALRFFGTQTKPLHKVLQYSSDIIIPGVTGSESGAIAFLQSLGINPKGKKGWRKISDLDSAEQQKLVDAILTKLKLTDRQTIFTNTYLFTREPDESPFRDAKEFATLLNSCGRLNKASLGIGACLNDSRLKELALKNLYDYRKEIVLALNWYKDPSNEQKIIRLPNAIIINAGDDVIPTIIGTLGSILAKSVDVEKNTFILSMARNHDETTKVSLRISGNPAGICLRSIIESVISRTGNGTSGGHSYAAGAVIDSAYEEQFIAHARELLEPYQFT